MPSPPKIIVGIDFGTTYSGVAWAHTSTPKDIIPIRQWPDATGKHDVDKVPSEMVYLPDGTFKWGFQTTPERIRKDGKLLQFMKLLLDPSQEKGSLLADPLGLNQIRANLPPGMKPVDVIADYLGALKDHTLRVLSKNFGTEFWKVIDIEYHLTIPAVWSESAKALTLQAANQAGIGSSQALVLIAEPEAAALYCLTDLYPSLLEVGDTFVVADCGGGTVDLVSYKVLAREPKLEVKEVAVGGGLCGSVFLNRRFEAFVRRRLGPAIVDGMLRKGKPYYKMMKEFDERLKRTFQDSEDLEVMDAEVPGLLDNPATRVEDGFMEIDREEMQQIFDPVIDEILRLIQDQFTSVSVGGHNTVNTLLLVGGFGSSPYLYQRVQKHIESLPGDSSGIKILQPANAWGAVARGAVICGLQSISIKSRQARRNYGVKCRQPWNPLIHRAAHRVWDNVQLSWWCDHCVSWYVKQGDEVTESQKIAFPFSRTFSLEETDFVRTSRLVASNSPGKSVEDTAAHPNVYEVCRITVDLKSLFDHFQLKRNLSGKEYYNISYNIVMYIHSAQLTFGLEVDDVSYGSTITATFV